MNSKHAFMIGLDGADPLVVKRLIAQDRLPGLKKIMQNGVSHESLSMLGAFPTVTPPNWASLATGCWPRTHGITCFQNHTLGKSLGILQANWDSRRMEAETIWEAFEESGKRSIMLNYCQAWPNRVEGSENIFVDGTGVEPYMRDTADFQKHITFDADFVSIKTIPHFVDQNASDCVVYGDQIEKFTIPQDDIEAQVKGCLFSSGTPLLESPAFVIMNYSPEQASKEDVIDQVYSPLKEPKVWSVALPEDALELTYPVNKGLERHFAVLSKSDGQAYDTLSFYADRKSAKMGEAKVGQWSDWLYATFNIDDEPTPVAYKMRVIDIAPDGRSGRLYMSHTNILDQFDFIYPPAVGQALLEHVGPMLLHASFQRYSEEGSQIMLESFEQLIDWHIRAARYLFSLYPDWGLFYTHLHPIDLVNHWYINEAIEGAHPTWQYNAYVIERIYEICDRFVEAMADDYLAAGETTFFITSDHGAIPRSVGCHNPGISDLSGINCKVMHDLGYTAILPVPGMDKIWMIDWTQTKAIQARSSHIYVNLIGRDPEGIVEPKDYDQLVQQIISDLYAYRDPHTGGRVVAFAMTREEMEAVGMGGEHCGDIFFQLTKDYGEEHAHAPSYVTNHGYSLACLCMMAGNGLKQGEWINRPIRIVDIVPTICHVSGVRQLKNVEGGVIYQALAE